VNTFEQLRSMLQRDFDLSQNALQPGTTLEGLDIDSLRMIEILFSIEDEFKITVPAEHAELRTRLKTLGDLSDYIEELLAAKAQALP
jgi:acyl carrier protein